MLQKFIIFDLETKGKKASTRPQRSKPGTSALTGLEDGTS